MSNQLIIAQMQNIIDLNAQVAEEYRKAWETEKEHRLADRAWLEHQLYLAETRDEDDRCEDEQDIEQLHEEDEILTDLTEHFKELWELQQSDFPFDENPKMVHQCLFLVARECERRRLARWRNDMIDNLTGD